MSDDVPAPGETGPAGTLDDPVPVRRHASVFAAELDVARLAEAGIPARVVEPRGPAGPMPALRPGGGGAEPVAVIMVPAARREEATGVLDRAAPDPVDDPEARPATRGTADPGQPEDAAAAADEFDRDEPFRARGMPRLARLGLVVAVLLLLLGVFGAIATLFIAP